MLFAVLLSALVLSMGVSILSISRKEVILSSAGRESISAIYAADMGLECALYWDNHSDAFSTSTDRSTDVIRCNGQPIATGQVFPTGYTETGLVGGGGDGQPTSKFWLDIDPMNGSEHYCAIVYVTKQIQSGETVSVLESRGYNTCDTKSERRVERALRLSPSS